MKIPSAVLKANYLEGYKVLVTFSDQSSKVVDFENFLTRNSHPQYNKYRDTTKFKKFKIENGNLVWGKDWDLIFPIEQVYSGLIY